MGKPEEKNKEILTTPSHLENGNLLEFESQKIHDLQQQIVEKIKNTLTEAGLLADQQIKIPGIEPEPTKDIPLAETIGATLLNTTIKSILKTSPNITKEELEQQLITAIENGRFDMTPDEIFTTASALATPDVVNLVLKQQSFFREFLYQLQQKD